LRRREARTPKAGWLKDLVANPLVLAIVGGFITLMTGILTGAHTASQNREAEALRANPDPVADQRVSAVPRRDNLR
jgi:hypothetical protein